MSSASARTADRPAGLTREHAVAQTDVQARPWIRLAGFTALALYGIERWSRLLVTPPSLRLIGLAALAIGFAGAMPPLRRRLAPLPRYLSRTIVGLISFGVVLAAFPLAGLRWHLVWYLKISVAAGKIGHGLTGLGSILVPYDGFDHRVTLVVMLGAAVLLLDAGAVLGFAPRRISDARRATAALAADRTGGRALHAGAPQRRRRFRDSCCLCWSLLHLGRASALRRRSRRACAAGDRGARRSRGGAADQRR